MPAWAAFSLLYFFYVIAAGLALPGLTRRARIRACAVSALGLVLAGTAALTDAFWLRLFVLPPLTLLVAYWASGCLWVAPMRRVEAFFLRSDKWLRIPQIAARTPRVIVELLEFAYAGVYPLVPIALGLHLACVAGADADRFWTVILITDFICFAMLPWIQTRPPRALEPTAPWRSDFRSFNVRLLGETSIGVNTVPSGHAAEALAAALLVSGSPWPVVVVMWSAVLAVSAGAVLGRYHFALDALAGWAVALAVWLAF